MHASGGILTRNSSKRGAGNKHAAIGIG